MTCWTSRQTPWKIEEFPWRLIHNTEALKYRWVCGSVVSPRPRGAVSVGLTASSMGSWVEGVIEDDNATLVLYAPSVSWATTTEAWRHGGSYHRTYEGGAYVSVTFNGSYIAYYSDMNVDYGAFTASIDGQPIMQGSAKMPEFVSNTLLFSTAVEPGVHTLTITNVQNGVGMGVDYFLFHTDGSSPFTLGGRPPDSHSDSSSGISRSTFALTLGLLWGVLLPLCCIVPTILFLRARRRLRDIERSSVRPLTSLSPQEEEDQPLRNHQPTVSPFLTYQPPPYRTGQVQTSNLPPSIPTVLDTKLRLLGSKS